MTADLAAAKTRAEALRDAHFAVRNAAIALQVASDGEENCRTVATLAQARTDLQAIELVLRKLRDPK